MSYQANCGFINQVTAKIVSTQSDLFWLKSCSQPLKVIGQSMANIFNPGPREPQGCTHWLQPISITPVSVWLQIDNVLTLWIQALYKQLNCLYKKRESKMSQKRQDGRTIVDIDIQQSAKSTCNLSQGKCFRAGKVIEKIQYIFIYFDKILPTIIFLGQLNIFTRSKITFLNCNRSDQKMVCVLSSPYCTFRFSITCTDKEDVLSEKCPDSGRLQPDASQSFASVINLGCSSTPCGFLGPRLKT